MTSPNASDCRDKPLADEAVERAFVSTLGVPFTGGNSVQPLCNGAQIFPAMLTAIDAAEHRVRLLTFIYWGGEVARRFSDALCRKARQGLRVEVLVDDIGSLAMPGDLVEQMVAAGVHFRRFRPVSRLRVLRINNRTHRKILVCDGTVAFIGGVGIADEWEGDAREPGEWRETHFMVKGPAVGCLEGIFLDNWLESGASLEDHWGSSEGTEATEALGSIRAQIVRSHGVSNHSDIRTATVLIVRLARRALRIQTAYFVPDKVISDELCAAARRGVEVEVMLPGEHTDHRLCNLAGRAKFSMLLDAGVKIWIYNQTMLHAKVTTVDGSFAMVGSPNFNQRSTRRDDEVAMILIDAALTNTLDGHFDADLGHCVAIDPKVWPQRGVVARAKEWLASFARSQL